MNWTVFPAESDATNPSAAGDRHEQAVVRSWCMNIAKSVLIGSLLLAMRGKQLLNSFSRAQATRESGQCLALFRLSYYWTLVNKVFTQMLGYLQQQHPKYKTHSFFGNATGKWFNTYSASSPTTGPKRESFLQMSFYERGYPYLYLGCACQAT